MHIPHSRRIRISGLVHAPVLSESLLVPRIAAPRVLSVVVVCGAIISAVAFTDGVELSFSARVVRSRPKQQREGSSIWARWHMGDTLGGFSAAMVTPFKYKINNSLGCC